MRTVKEIHDELRQVEKTITTAWSDLGKTEDSHQREAIWGTLIDSLNKSNDLKRELGNACRAAVAEAQALENASKGGALQIK
jgi:hypothetical protein